VYSDEGDTLKLTDIAPNISMAVGRRHNTLIVATDRYLVAFEAPIDDGLSQWVIKAAAEKYPGKRSAMSFSPITTSIIPAACAPTPRKAPPLSWQGNGAFYRKVLSAPNWLDPYPVKLSGAPKVIEVNGKWSINGRGTRDRRVFPEDTHATNYIVPYVPDAKLGLVTDIWSPGRPLPMTADAAMIRW